MVSNNRKGQNAIEYMLLLAAVVLVLLVALRPNGFLTQALNRSLNASFSGVSEMTSGVYYNVFAEPGTTVQQP